MRGLHGGSRDDKTRTVFRSRLRREDDSGRKSHMLVSTDCDGETYCSGLLTSSLLSLKKRRLGLRGRSRVRPCLSLHSKHDSAKRRGVTVSVPEQFTLIGSNGAANRHVVVFTDTWRAQSTGLALYHPVPARVSRRSSRGIRHHYYTP